MCDGCERTTGPSLCGSESSELVADGVEIRCGRREAFNRVITVGRAAVSSRRRRDCGAGAFGSRRDRSLRCATACGAWSLASNRASNESFGSVSVTLAGADAAGAARAPQATSARQVEAVAAAVILAAAALEREVASVGAEAAAAILARQAASA
eukprot:5602808-Pleurochrysis_carterae.AAC.2